MPKSWRKFLIGLALFLSIGTAVGWIYGRPDLGLLTATLLALIWQVRQLLAFDRATRTNDFQAFRYGDGIWQQLFSRFSYANERATKHKQRHRVLLREIRKSTNAMPDGAVILDEENEIVTCNRAAKHLAGLKRRKDRGQRVDNILRHPELTALLHADDTKKSIEIPSPVDANAWLNCRVVPYGTDQKMLLLRDVTERMRLNKMRRDFVANASHELRSPLTVIAGYLETFTEDELPRGWAFPVGQMQAQARRMNLIINELLELSRLESAGPASMSDVVDVPALIVAARKSFQANGDNPEIAVDIRSSSQLHGNAGQIESVITNLVSNAVRYTPTDGRVTISWSEGKKGYDLVVSDTGEGISAEDIPRVTERFFRVDRGRSRDDGGVGLGLAIVKHILSRHDAELTIDSTIGEGSAFRCHFPSTRIVEKDEYEVASG